MFHVHGAYDDPWRSTFKSTMSLWLSLIDKKLSYYPWNNPCWLFSEGFNSSDIWRWFVLVLSQFLKRNAEPLYIYLVSNGSVFHLRRNSKSCTKDTASCCSLKVKCASSWPRYCSPMQSYCNNAATCTLTVLTPKGNIIVLFTIPLTFLLAINPPLLLPPSCLDPFINLSSQHSEPPFP